MVVRPKRKSIPWRVKLISLLIWRGLSHDAAVLIADHLDPKLRDKTLPKLLAAGGLDHKAVQWDHDPALGLRPVNAAGDDYDPPQLDPRHIVPRAKDDHYRKTHGHLPGEGAATTADSDQGKIAKAERLEKARITAKLPEGFVRVGDIHETRVTVDKDGNERWTKRSFKNFPQGRKLQGRGFPKKDRG